MATKECSVAGCGREFLAKGLCSLHYQRVRHTGSADGNAKQSDDERFLSFVEVDPKTGAWIWRGGVNNAGYGVFWCEGRSVSAHRYAYAMKHGAIPDGMMVCHKFEEYGRHNVNPDHLFLGTGADNMVDASNKGRTLRGERNRASVLSSDDAVAISRSDEPCAVLAERYGVSETVVSSIRRGKTWSRVTGVKPAGRKRLDNKSGFIGVRWRERGKKWNAAIGRRIDGKYKSEYLGCYETAREAALAYDRAARRYFGLSATLNFPYEH